LPGSGRTILSLLAGDGPDMGAGARDCGCVSEASPKPPEDFRRYGQRLPREITAAADEGEKGMDYDEGRARRSRDVAVSVAPAKRSRSLAEVARPERVLTVSWCCSVGSTWALLLHEGGLAVRPGPSGWISSGVPITEPAPDSLAAELLTQRSYRLFYDPDAWQRTRSVRRLGFASHDAELILLAETIHAQPIEHLEHPLALAARWTTAGFSAPAAMNWVRSGILTPEAVDARASLSPTGR
jgi:hypothetical protein